MTLSIFLPLLATATDNFQSHDNHMIKLVSQSELHCEVIITRPSNRGASRGTNRLPLRKKMKFRPLRL